MTLYAAVVWFLGVLIRIAGIPAANYYNLGNQLYQQDQYCRAEEAYQKAFKKLALRSHAYYNAGNAAFQQNNFQQAITYYESALDLDPQDENTWHNLELARQRVESRRAKNSRDPGVLPKKNQAVSRSRKPEKKRGQSLSLAGNRRELNPDAADRILELSRQTERRLSGFFQPYRRKIRRASQVKDVFTMSPDRLMQYMRKQNQGSYPFGPGKSRRKRAPSPARDEIDW
ncbi:tetratricopeptide repeat protein [bacterium]|nr:tetratricopeptide repeat protein [bacterium]